MADVVIENPVLNSSFGERFIVRHAYFTGADEPYDKLKRALRAEIDESAWSALYTTNPSPSRNLPTKARSRSR
jgi:hypothetical protein